MINKKAKVSKGRCIVCDKEFYRFTNPARHHGKTSARPSWSKTCCKSHSRRYATHRKTYLKGIKTRSR